MKTNFINPSLKLTQIANQLRLVYDGDPWYGPSIKSVIKHSNPDLVFESPDEATHSIAELVAHMVTWREFAEQRLRRQDDFLPDQEASFDWRRFTTSKGTAWDTLVDRLHLNQQNLLRLLREKDDSMLENNVAGKPYDFQYLLNGFIQHDLYHLGQIVYIQKILEKKSPATTTGEYDFRIFSYENLSLDK